MTNIRDIRPPAQQAQAQDTATPLALPGFAKWAAGIAATWFGLAVLSEVDSTRPLAVALAWAIVGGMVLGNGPRIVAALTAAGFKP